MAQEGRGAGACQALTPPRQSFLGGEVPWASLGGGAGPGTPRSPRGVPGSPTPS